MTNLFSGNYIWQLVSSADTISKLVLLTLVGMSIVCWAIMLYKSALLRMKRAQFEQAQRAMASVTTLHDLLNVGQQLQQTVPGYLLSYGAVVIKNLLQTEQGQKQKLDAKEFELVQSSLDQALQDIMQQEEEYLPVLATSAAAAPLIGLFGTVWGLIHAFVRIAERQSADITTVAPGIAEALITTLAGLVVAIPALVMYHYLQITIRKNEHKLVAIADRFEWIVKRSVVE